MTLMRHWTPQQAIWRMILSCIRFSKLSNSKLIEGGVMGDADTYFLLGFCRGIPFSDRLRRDGDASSPPNKMGGKSIFGLICTKLVRKCRLVFVKGVCKSCRFSFCVQKHSSQKFN